MGPRTLVMQNEDGQIEEPYSISAGLDYPGIGPVHANLAAQKRATVLAVDDDEALYAAFERRVWKVSSRPWNRPTRWARCRKCISNRKTSSC